MNTFDWVTQLLYVTSAVCFVLGLHLMNSPASARRGNQVSTAGMALAIVTTFALVVHAGTVSATGWAVMIAGALAGAGAGLYSARTVQMTAMPQLVSLFSAVGGGAAALVAINDYVSSGHKLLIYDSDRCSPGEGGSADYSWFLFPLTSSAPVAARLRKLRTFSGATSGIISISIAPSSVSRVTH